MSGDALVLDAVSVVLGERRIVDDVSLRFPGAGVTALIGPNGAGKSTLLAVAAGDIAPTRGSAMLAGKPVREWRARALATRRAVMPQDHAVRFAFSVREVVAMGRLPYPPDPVRDDALVDEALQVADITALAGRDVQSLSGGEAARTAFARVLAQRTGVVFLDEPTAALDLRHQAATLRAARALAEQGACVLVVLHDLNLAAAHADRIVVLEQGRVVADGTPWGVLTREVIERVYRQPVRVLRHPERDIPLVVMAG